MNLIKKIKSQHGIAMLGPIMAPIIASTILTTLILGTSEWYLSLNKEKNAVDTALKGQTVAMNKWDEIIHQSLKDKETNVDKTDVTTDENGNKITVEYGKRGVFQNGVCNTSVTQDQINKAYQSCTPVKVRVDNKDGKKLYEFESENLLSTNYVYPVGTIIPYTGKFDEIPDNWALCDGTNGTPDLNGRYLKGTMSQSEIGTTGGHNTFVLEEENLPSEKLHVTAPGERLIVGAISNFNPSGWHSAYWRKNIFPNEEISDIKDVISHSSHNSGYSDCRGHACPHEPSYPATDVHNPVYVLFCGDSILNNFIMHSLRTTIHVPAWTSKPMPITPEHQTVAYIIKVK